LKHSHSFDIVEDVSTKKIAIFILIFLLLATIFTLLIIFSRRNIPIKTSESTRTVTYTYGNDSVSPGANMLVRGSIKSYTYLTQELIVTIDPKIKSVVGFDELTFDLKDLSEVTCWPKTIPGTAVALKDAFIQFNGQAQLSLSYDRIRPLAWNSTFIKSDEYAWIIFPTPNKIESNQKLSNVSQLILTGCE